MAWHLAPAVDQLIDQVNVCFPRRSRISDGTLGDAAHRARSSDHNPDDDRSVNAVDFTHNPPYFDCNRFVAELVASNDERIEYIIWRRRIWMRATGWSAYGGENPHDKHCHVSIPDIARLENSRANWKLPMLGLGTPSILLPPPDLTRPIVHPQQPTESEDDMASLLVQKNVNGKAVGGVYILNENILTGIPDVEALQWEQDIRRIAGKPFQVVQVPAKNFDSYFIAKQ